MMTKQDFLDASKIVNEAVVPTKLVYSESLSQACGNNVYLKPENMQFTGSYKVRGAYYKISTLPEEDRSRGLITASAGNHAQGVAYAAKKFGAKAIIVMPTMTPLIKINRTKSYGAEVELFGSVYDDAYARAAEMAEQQNYQLIHPFNDETVAMGQGSVAVEILEELPNADVILVPVGGGGLLAGVSTYVKTINPKIKVIGVEPAGASCVKESLRVGHVVSLPKVETIADGTAVREPGDKIFPYIRENVDEIITVEDEELIGSFLDIIENHKMIVENSGLLTVAALKHLNCWGKNVVSILSGGNMDIITLSSVVQHGLIQRGRVFTLSVLLPDKPGQLVGVAGIIADMQGNVIRLEHNQFVSINRNSAVELKITMEAFGFEHRDAILKELIDRGYKATLVQRNSY